PDATGHRTIDRIEWRGRHTGGQLISPANGALTAQAVSDLVGGRLLGAGDLLLRRVRSLETAGPEDLAICSGGRWLAALAATRAGAVLVAPEIAAAPGPAARVVIGEPMRALCLIAPSLGGEAASAPGIDPTARIGAGAVLGDGVRIDPYAVIGDGAVIGADSVIKSHVVVEADVRIGTAVRIDPGAVIHRGAVLGDRVYIKSRAVIGGPGFGFASDQNGHQRIPQVGGCILGDDVEIGAG